MHVILFEDDRVVNLYPITIGRPAFYISVGSMRLLNLARQFGDMVELVARPHLRAILREDFPFAWSPSKGERKGPILFINARTAPREGLFNAWRALTTGQFERGAILCSGNSIAAAIVNDPRVPPTRSAITSVSSAKTSTVASRAATIKRFATVSSFRKTKRSVRRSATAS